LTWSATANVNLTEGKDLENNEPLRHTTPVFGMASLNYKQKKINGEFFVRFNGARTRENLPPSERNKTHIYSSDGSLAWYTLNLRGQYTLTDWLTMNAALENILDHHYRTYSSGISAPGRNFIISIKASF
jgi:hemoglobin/transferrin/lactoferrin receptor protein